jgi:hypothetical protein
VNHVVWHGHKVKVPKLFGKKKLTRVNLAW